MIEHTIVNGENLQILSARYCIPVCMIVRANHLKKASEFRAGARLYIPDPSFCLNAYEGIDEYTVKKGDTLFSIAKQFGITMDTLMRANAISHPNMLAAGDKLRIPLLPANFFVYTISMAESLNDISKKYGISISEICNINNIRSGIYPGMQIVLPKNNLP